MAKDICGFDWKVIETPKKVKKSRRIELMATPELVYILQEIAWYNSTSVSFVINDALRTYLSDHTLGYSQEVLDAAFGQRY